MTMDAAIPTRIETERLYLRAYVAADKDWYFKMSENNRAHLLRYEFGNPVHSIHSPQDTGEVLESFEKD